MKSGLLGVIAMAGFALTASGTDSDRFPWLTDLEAAKEAATLQEKPLLIVFRCEP